MERVFKGESMSPMVNGYLLFMKPLNLEKHYKKTFKIFVVFIVWMFIVNVVIMKLDDKSISRDWWWGSNIIKIGQNSLGIYLFFWIYTRFLKNFINVAGYIKYVDNIVSNLLIVLFIMLISYISNEIIKKIPILKEIVKI